MLMLYSEVIVSEYKQRFSVTLTLSEFLSEIAEQGEGCPVIWRWGFSVIEQFQLGDLQSLSTSQIFLNFIDFIMCELYSFINVYVA